MDEQYLEKDQQSAETALTVKPKKTRKRKNKDKPKNEVPSIQRAWKVGYTAAQANLPETRNPFDDNSSQEYDAWLEGWWSGFYDEPLHAGIGALN